MSTMSTNVCEGSRAALLGAALLLAAGCAQGDGERAPTDADPVRSALVAGSTAHLYWKGRSNTGAPIAVTALLPPGFTAEPLLWPAPERHVSPGRILDHVYRDEVLLILPVVVPGAAPPGSEARFAADLEWVVCRDECRVGRSHVELTLPVVAIEPPGMVPAPDEEPPLFVRFRRRLPWPWPQDRPELSATWQGDVLVVADERGSDLVFHPNADCGRLVDLLADGVGGGGRLRIRFVARGGVPGPARGILEIRPPDGSGPVWYELDVPRPGAGNAGYSKEGA
jgi:hypothetical protein